MESIALEIGREGVDSDGQHDGFGVASAPCMHGVS